MVKRITNMEPNARMGVLPFAIEHASPAPLTLQVVTGLRKAMSSGFFKVGDCLPSREAMSATLGVSEFVIRSALRELSSNGFVLGRPRQGFRVIAVPDPQKVRGKLVLDVSTENGGSYASRISTSECARSIAKGGHSVLQVILGVDARGTSYLQPLKEALDKSPDFVIVRTTAGRRQVVTRMIADKGCPYATITLGQFHRSPGRFEGNMRHDSAQAIAAMIRDCQRVGIHSVLQVDFGRDTYVNAESNFCKSGLFVERLSVSIARCRNLDDIVIEARRVMDERIQRGALPDLVFVTDDYLAIGVREALLRKGMKAPQDVRLVIYANVGSGLYPFLDMARFEFDPKRDGCEIGRCVLKWLETGQLGTYDNPFTYRRGASFVS